MVVWIRTVLALALVGVGVAHFILPEPFVRIVPPSLPAPETLVYVSGVFEILGGLGVLWPATRRAAGAGLLALFLAVFPANIHMAIAGIDPISTMPGTDFARWARLPFQLPLLWWAWTLARSDPWPEGDRHPLLVARAPLWIGALIAIALPASAIDDSLLLGSTLALTTGLLLAVGLLWVAFESEVIITPERVVVVRGPWRWSAPREGLRATGDGHPVRLIHGKRKTTVRPERPRPLIQSLLRPSRR